MGFLTILYSFQETNKPLVINCTLVYPCHRLKQLQLALLNDVLLDESVFS